MSYKQKDGRIYGVMPNGCVQVFSSIHAYEDAWADAMFASMNEYELDIPECW